MRKRNYDKSSTITAYLMLIPIVGLLLVFVIIPFINALRISFYNWSFYKPATFIGLGNYIQVLNDPEFLHSVLVGVEYTFCVIPVQLVLAFLIANVIKGMRKRPAGFVKTSIYIPTVISGVIASVIFNFIFNYEGGLANYILTLFGMQPQAWLADRRTALLSISVPGVWLGLGFSTLIMLAGMLDIPVVYYEAAELDGAGRFQKMIYVTIPLLKNILLYLLITGFAGAMQEMQLPLLMTAGGPLDATTTPNLYIYNHFENDVYVGPTIAAALLLFAVLGTISALIFRVLQSEKAVDE
ncbi:MAG: sugar ABC transporter permease [Alicyclobacillus sp.]|nr:sugar ABC transporter permease [Alicyclobacillus sp.]